MWAVAAKTALAAQRMLAVKRALAAEAVLALEAALGGKVGGEPRSSVPAARGSAGRGVRLTRAVEPQNPRGLRTLEIGTHIRSHSAGRGARLSPRTPGNH